MNTSIIELNSLTETEKLYRINERLEDFHANNGDWKAVLQDKWHLLRLSGGN